MRWRNYKHSSIQIIMNLQLQTMRDLEILFIHIHKWISVHISKKLQSSRWKVVFLFVTNTISNNYFHLLISLLFFDIFFKKIDLIRKYPDLAEEIIPQFVKFWNNITDPQAKVWTSKSFNKRDRERENVCACFEMTDLFCYCHERR